MSLAVDLPEKVRGLAAEVGWQDGLGRRPAEGDPGCGAFLPDDVIDQAVDAIARHLGAAAVVAGDSLQCRDQSSLIDVRAMLAHIGAGSLHQVLADMQLTCQAGAERVT